MLDKITGFFGKLKFLGPVLSTLPQLVDLIGNLIRVKVRDEDADTLREGCTAALEATAQVRAALDEVDDVLLVVIAAVDPDSDGGTAITFDEMKMGLEQVKEVDDPVKLAVAKFDAAFDKLKTLA